MTYIPRGSDPTDIHWIQAIRVVWSEGGGVKSRIELDYHPAAKNLTKPWYDAEFSSGSLPNNGNWVGDIPAIRALPGVPNWNEQFQTFLAVDHEVAGKHNVTLYGGYWWGFQYTTSPAPAQRVELEESTSPSGGAADRTFVSITGSGFPEGGVNPANLVVEMANDCQGEAAGKTSAVSIVSGWGDSKMISFLLPGGLEPGKYFVSISDSAEGDANFGTSNCSSVTVVQ